MCQECIDDMSNASLENKPQTVEQCIFWLEIGGYSILRLPGFYNDYNYIVSYPNGVVSSLSVDRMRYKAICAWWRYQLT